MSIQSEIKKGIACDSVGHPHSIIGRTICLSVHPGKMLLFPFLKWFEKRYAGKYKYAKTLFAFDMFLLGVALTLTIVALVTWLSPPPSTFEDRIVFEASVAPREVVTGASSTLIIRYTNHTDEELRDAVLRLTFPNHFVLESIDTQDSAATPDRITLDTIPVGGTGTVHIRGAMFGDVGGKQIFESELTFLHGTEKDIPGRKTAEYLFSPMRSSLALSLELPTRMLAFQHVEGVIVYENTGIFDFPNITIEPEWPEGFQTAIKIFELPAIKAGEKGRVTFKGYLGDVDGEIQWIFKPSFTFTDEQFKQDTLIHRAPVVSAPINISHSVENASLVPGGTAAFHIAYEHVGAFPISELTLGIESMSPFFSKPETFSMLVIKDIQPGDRGSVDVNIPLRSTIHQSETSTYENIIIETRSLARYVLGDGSGQRVTSKGATIQSPVTTPLIFDAFARYTTASGDQIGRGPLPPRVAQETTYWIFWNIQGTTNAIDQVSIEGILPEYVVFTGRQSTSQNGGVLFDPTTRAVRWSADRISPTLSPTSKIVGVAFEVELRPTIDQIGTSPVLMQDIIFSAKDSITGALLTRTHTSISTSIEQDERAKGKSDVVAAY